jgi:hypothetical protein
MLRLKMWLAWLDLQRARLNLQRVRFVWWAGDRWTDSKTSLMKLRVWLQMCGAVVWIYLNSFFERWKR